MDHLSRLPIEVWREIFILETPFIMTPELFSKGPYDDQWASMSVRIHKPQIRRGKLLTICKSLYPLIESLLFSEVTLHHTLHSRHVE